MTNKSPIFEPSSYHTEQSKEVRDYYSSNAKFASALESGEEPGMGGVITAVLLTVLIGMAFPLGYAFSVGFFTDNKLLSWAIMALIALVGILAVILIVGSLCEFRTHWRFRSFRKAAPSSMATGLLTASEKTASEELYAWLKRNFGLRVAGNRASRDAIARDLLLERSTSGNQVLEVELERENGTSATGYFNSLGGGKFELLSIPDASPGVNNSFPQVPALSWR